MKKDLISIIVPIYNSEKTLERCVRSIINQTYKNLEIILINDGSNDNSLNICKDLKKIDDRIKIIDSKNEGVSSARNKGIENALGKYIMFADSDDYVSNVWCESLYSIVDDNNFSICNIYCVDEITKEISVENNLLEEKINFSIEDFFEVYKMKLLNQPYNKIYNKDRLNEFNIRFDETLSLGEDLLFNLEYLMKCYRIEIINKRTYYYIKGRDDSLCNKYYFDFYEIQIKLNLKLLECLKSLNCEYVYRHDFYTGFLFCIINSIRNIYSKNNKQNIVKKIKKSRNILHNKYYDLCLINVDKKIFNKIYWYILKIKSSFLIIAYYKLCDKKLNFSLKKEKKNEN